MGICDCKYLVQCGILHISIENDICVYSKLDNKRPYLLCGDIKLGDLVRFITDLYLLCNNSPLIKALSAQTHPSRLCHHPA